jgi:hypothetical protein
VLPSTAVVEVQVSGSKFESTLIRTELGRIEPQTDAAWLNTLSRCAPRVVPGLPPIGGTTVGSLKPSPAPSLLTIWIVAAETDVAASVIASSAIAR